MRIDQADQLIAAIRELVTACSDQTGAINRLTEACNHLARLMIDESVETPKAPALPGGTTLSEFLETALERELIEYTSRPKALIDWLQGMPPFDKDNTSRDQEARKLIRNSGGEFKSGYVRTPQGLAQLFKSGTMDRIRLPNLGRKTKSEIKAALKLLDYL